MSEKKRDRDDRPNAEQDEERSTEMEDQDRNGRQDPAETEEFEEAGTGTQRTPSNPPRKKK